MAWQQIKILRLVFMLFFFMHLFACVWFVTVCLDYKWTTTPDYYYVGNTR